jgi:hypothetical protein
MASRSSAVWKEIFSGMSRRGVLLGVGAGLIGAVLASVGVGKAAAAGGRGCVVFCSQQSASGPVRASCQQACHRCKGDTSRVCGTPTGFVCCPSGEVCSPATNQCVEQCTCESFTPCGSAGSGCLCNQTTEGTSACIVPTCTFQPCTSSAECGAGSVCFVSGEPCCGSGSFCIPLCSSPSGAFLDETN